MFDESMKSLLSKPQTSMDILPAILAHDADEFRSQMLFPGLKTCAPVVHVDILDGTLFNASCFADPDVVARFGALPEIELHVMTQNPLKHIEAWKSAVPSVVRAIVHLEIGSAMTSTINSIVDLDLDAGIAVSPNTPIDAVKPFVDEIERVLIMGITPGASGKTFLGEQILAKLKRAHQLFPELTIALDGGVTLENANEIANAGATCLVAGSAIWRSAHPVRACEQLVHITTLPSE